MQDVQYADIDHYDERKVFTVDDKLFAGLPQYFRSLREDGIRTIIILVSIMMRPHNYSFVKWNNSLLEMPRLFNNLNYFADTRETCSFAVIIFDHTAYYHQQLNIAAKLVNCEKSVFKFFAYYETSMQQILILKKFPLKL